MTISGTSPWNIPRSIGRRGLSDRFISRVRKTVWHTFVKLYSISDVDRLNSVRLSVALQNVAVKRGLGREEPEILQHLNTK